MKREELKAGRLYNAICTDGKTYPATMVNGFVYCVRPATTTDGRENNIESYEEVNETELDDDLEQRIACGESFDSAMQSAFI